ncbi:site-specific integrase [Cesiribacter sp. SM1]|uniref:site-specific integrase n=1 Tax=Cesiribacter sp. SM1 TaxID=2861196 RepID=UPI001CD1A090|nr:site-specific integrase [Cesiribacter sp. SM1]
MATVNFYLRDPKAKNKSAILLQFNAGKPILLSTGRSIPPKYWRSNKQEVHGSYPGGVDINLYLAGLRKSCLNAYECMLESSNLVSISDIEAKLKDVINGKKPTAVPDLLTNYDEFLKEKASQLKPLTVKKYNTLRKLLVAYADEHNLKLTLDQINRKFDLAFRHYLTEEKKQSNNTVSKYYDCLKVFMAWARKQGLHAGTDYKEFAAPRSKKDVIFLTEPELMLLYNKEELSERLVKIRDTFCFQCFTGQRFSDVCALKWSDIKETPDGQEWHLYQIKGNKPKKVVVPLMPPAMVLLERYRNNTSSSNQKVFPTISNVKTNEYIKELCEKAGIKEITTTVHYSGKQRKTRTEPKHKFISTHTARRTFVTLSLEKGMNPETIMEVTGHEDYRTMKQYLKITDKLKRAEMNKAWNTYTSTES